MVIKRTLKSLFSYVVSSSSFLHTYSLNINGIKGRIFTVTHVNMSTKAGSEFQLQPVRSFRDFIASGFQSASELRNSTWAARLRCLTCISALAAAPRVATKRCFLLPV